MADKITILSLNCRGLRDNFKRKDVFNYLREKKYAIYCLQDTHFTETEENIIRAQWGFECHFSHGRRDSRGVCILLNNNFDFKINQVIRDEDGNYIIMLIELENNIKLTLINIYGPNKDDPEFYKNLKTKLSDSEEEFIIICGDMNMVQDFNLDYFNYVTKNNTKARLELLDIKDEFNLIDPWRTKKPRPKTIHMV